MPEITTTVLKELWVASNFTSSSLDLL